MNNFNEYISKLFGVRGVTIPEENTYGYWYQFARDISRASFTDDYELLYDTIWPHVKRIFEKHYGELVTVRLLDTITQELNCLYNQVMESATVNRDMAALTFRSCVYAAERWDFELEECERNEHITD
ncbi:MAG: hypothetical protein IJU23_09140 [Proteobacteria bacterium]|nr:hypothetical protein [Pseudomonadota bacterium]